MIFMGLFESYQKLEMRDTKIVLHNVVFGRLFGPWARNYNAKQIIVDLLTLTINEIDVLDEVINSQQIRLVTKNDKLKEIIDWLNDEKMDHLYTKDGSKVFSFYSGTSVEKNLRELYDEVKLERRDAPSV